MRNCRIVCRWWEIVDRAVIASYVDILFSSQLIVVSELHISVAEFTQLITNIFILPSRNLPIPYINSFRNLVFHLVLKPILAFDWSYETNFYIMCAVGPHLLLKFLILVSFCTGQFFLQNSDIYNMFGTHLLIRGALQISILRITITFEVMEVCFPVLFPRKFVNNHE